MKSATLTGASPRTAAAPRNASPRAWRRWLGVLVVVAVLGPTMFGFGAKFVELVRVYQGDPQGIFAIAPIVNYLLASMGFLLLFAWAAANGMFRNIEQPKRTMLENEARLDNPEPRRKAS